MAQFTPVLADPPARPQRRAEGWLRQLEAALGLHITVHDHVGFFRDGDGAPLLPGRNIHQHRYCQQERGRTVQHCVRHCVDQVHAQALRRRRPFATRCWKGVREIVLPLLHDEVHVATLYAGAWRSARARPDLRDAPRAAELRAMRAALPVWDAERARTIAAHLELWGHGLLARVLALRDYAGSDDRRVRIHRFIEAHAHERLRLADLAAELALSASRCSHCVRECCGASFQELLLRERVTRAQVLLRSSPHSLATIAERCGFGDVYAFGRVFRREVGLPPGGYRRRYGQSAP